MKKRVEGIPAQEDNSRFLQYLYQIEWVKISIDSCRIVDEKMINT